MAVSSALAFWALSLLLIVVPGADWAFTLSAGLQGGSVLAAVGGLLLGYLGVTAVVAAGVGLVIARSPAALTALTLVGGTYLVLHGVRTLAGPVALPTRSEVGDGGPGGLLLRGIGVSGLNPKGLLIFLALLPQFTNPDGTWPVAVQIALLGGIFVVTCGVFYSVLGSVVRVVLLDRPGAARVAARLAGGGMVAVGVALVVERLLALG